MPTLEFRKNDPDNVILNDEIQESHLSPEAFYTMYVDGDNTNWYYYRFGEKFCFPIDNSEPTFDDETEAQAALYAAWQAQQ